MSPVVLQYTGGNVLIFYSGEERGEERGGERGEERESEGCGAQLGNWAGWTRAGSSVVPSVSWPSHTEVDGTGFSGRNLSVRAR